MRPKRMLRRSRPVQLGVGAVMLAIPASAFALSAGRADTQSAIPITLSPHRLAFGHRVTVGGTLTSAQAGQTVQLEFAPGAGPGTRWRALATTRVRADGSFRFVVPVKRSGLVMVVRPAGTSTSPTAQPGATSASVTVPNTTQRVSVSAKFTVRRGSLEILGGRPVHVRGRLTPGLGGRHVRLLGRTGRSWHVLARARTGGRGGFDLHYRPGSTGAHSLRVGFAGDRLNTGSWARAGRVTVFRESFASWYSDGGGTACGFHAQFGVANKSLPCGTKVTFRYGRRTVTATVDDRGPYVGGREWDLNQNTAGALGFGGVDTVWSSS